MQVMADVILYHLDDKLSKLNGYYVRYSDDTLFVGEDYEKSHGYHEERAGDDADDAQSEEG